MPVDLPPEKEERMIEGLARQISKRNMELPAILFLSPYEAVSAIVGETLLVWISPFLDFAGVNGYKYSLLLRKKENVRRLVDRIEELRKERESKRVKDIKKVVSS